MIDWLAGGLWIGFVMINRLGFVFARGTRGRYVCRSVSRVLRWPGLLDPARLVIRADDALGYAAAGIMLMLWVLLVWQEEREDDDDFWKRLKGRLRRWARQRRTRTAPVVVGT